MDTKHKILEHLFKADGATLSGVKLSEETGISRVAVWKHITALKEEGVDIVSGPKGYHLSHPEDLLYPFCFDAPLSQRIHHFHTLGSTMDKARELAREGADHLSCILAEHQTQGRGRLDRKWDSDLGGLWFTLIIRPTEPPPLAYLYNFAASLALARSLNTLFPVTVKVKWPNDLLLQEKGPEKNGEKKLVGLLSEMETRADMVNFLLLGIGINVNNGVNDEGYMHRSTTLKQALGKALSRKKILAAFLTEFERLTQNLEPARIIAQWKQETATIGSWVRIQTFNDTLEGKALDVNSQGNLLVETATGQIQEVIYGDCFHT